MWSSFCPWPPSAEGNIQISLAKQALSNDDGAGVQINQDEQPPEGAARSGGLLRFGRDPALRIFVIVRDHRQVFSSGIGQ